MIVELHTKLQDAKKVCAEAYQLVGAIGAPVKVLDNLNAIANSATPPHETFLPVLDTDCSVVSELLARLAVAEKRWKFLERHTINVRAPRVYGSRDLFWYSPPFDESGDLDPLKPTLAQQVDQMLESE